MNLNNLLKNSLGEVDEEILMRLDATVPLLSKIGSHLIKVKGKRIRPSLTSVSYTHLRAHETPINLV